ncbi:alpha/beta fold hydrolase [Massilia cavernae]|uniref:Alpha/beta fold hydrolase n=1 Tax=Massilia cavernae TaxID=2320864 RepID=A0A418Y6N7_9BURK|nr:alpha/beta fold hydrolase [Massilia cavernae]RJG24143.1 alpha/beta fold hydrolase [Massilia cavernae]
MKTLPPLSHHVTGKAGAPWLTFIPGIGNDATFWSAQAAHLAGNFQVLTFDPWGHGASPPPPAGCRFDDVMQGVVQLWDRLGVQSSHVAGLGFGGSVALALALRHRQRVTGVAAFCCRPRQPDDRREFWRGRLATARANGIDALADTTVDRWLSAEFRAAHPAVDAQLRAMMKRTSVDGYCAYVEAFIEMDFEAGMADIKVPTLLVAAEFDHGGGPVEAMRGMAARIPGSGFTVVQDSGHICNFEAPERTGAILAAFLGTGDKQ